VKVKQLPFATIDRAVNIVKRNLFGIAHKLCAAAARLYPDKTRPLTFYELQRDSHLRWKREIPKSFYIPFQTYRSQAAYAPPP
jgi:hypothetical protein